MKVTINKTVGSYTHNEVFEFDVSVPAEKELAEKIVDIVTAEYRPFAIKCTGFPEGFDEDSISKLAASTKVGICCDD